MKKLSRNSMYSSPSLKSMVASHSVSTGVVIEDKTGWMDGAVGNCGKFWL